MKILIPIRGGGTFQVSSSKFVGYVSLNGVNVPISELMKAVGDCCNHDDAKVAGAELDRILERNAA